MSIFCLLLIVMSICGSAYLDAHFLMQSCGEHRESGILKHGFFAPSFLQDSTLLEAEHEMEIDRGESCVVPIRHECYHQF